MPTVKINITPEGFVIDAPKFQGCDKIMEKLKKLGKVKRVEKKTGHVHTRISEKTIIKKDI